MSINKEQKVVELELRLADIDRRVDILVALRESSNKGSEIAKMVRRIVSNLQKYSDTFY